MPAPAELAQIAYGADATLQNLLRTADATGLNGFRKLAAVQAAWYFGNNRSGAQMYDPATGRTFDGLGGRRTHQPQQRRRDTIHGLLSMLALDAHPDVAAAATSRNARVDQVTWSLVEAESGTLNGNASVVTPASAWTGESLWSGGGYVELGPGGRVTVSATLPETGRYRLLPVFDRQEARLRSLGTRHRFDSVPLGVQWQGGAGTQGVSPTSGYLDIGNVGTNRVFDARSVAIRVGVRRRRHAGSPRRAARPARDRAAGSLRGRRAAGRAPQLGDAAAPRRRSMRAHGGLTAFAYDANGRLVETRHGTGSFAVPVEAYGFTYLTGE